MTITVLLADDHHLVRAGLSRLIEELPDCHVVGEAANGREAVELATQLRPDVILMDLFMPELNGIEATRRIGALGLSSRVIALSMHSDRHLVIEALRAGAYGFLYKDCECDDLADAIRRVAAGSKALAPEAEAILELEFPHQDVTDLPDGSNTLTPREREVLQMVAEGFSTKMIASRLRISPKTVETHRRQLMAKLQLRSIAELTKYAVREGLTSLDG